MLSRYVLKMAVGTGNSGILQCVLGLFQGQALFGAINAMSVITYVQLNDVTVSRTYRICYFFSITAGLVAATMGTPADVIKTRIMNNPTAYRGVIDCFVTAVSIVRFSFADRWKSFSPYLILALAVWNCVKDLRRNLGGFFCPNETHYLCHCHWWHLLNFRMRKTKENKFSRHSFWIEKIFSNSLTMLFLVNTNFRYLSFAG